MLHNIYEIYTQKQKHIKQNEINKKKVENTKNIYRGHAVSTRANIRHSTYGYGYGIYTICVCVR